MSYAQRTYPQIQGINGKFPIAAIGCFLTSYSNLFLDYSLSIDPLTINNILRDKGLFVDIDDGIRDDVGWETISYIDSNMRVVAVGGVGWPNSNQSIVKFDYVHGGVRSTHFCKVANWQNRLIIDSYDGVTKSADTTYYGTPVAWATYHYATPAPVAPTPLLPTYSKRTITPKRIVFNKDTHLYNLSLRTIEEIVAPDKWVGNVASNATAPLWVDGIIDHISGHSYYTHEEPFGYATEDCDDYQEPVVAPYMPPAAPVEVPKAEKYTLVVPVMSFETANAAWSHNGQSKTLIAGEYYVISKKDNLYNLSTDNMKDKSQWVNTVDNVLPVEPPPVPLPASKPAPVPLPEKVIATITAAGESAQTIADDLATSWKVCSPLKLDDKGFWQPVKYVSTNSMPISIRSLDGKTPATLTLPAHKELDILSTFDSGKYARDVLLSDRHRFYALPMSMLTPVQEQIQETQVYSRLDVNEDGQVTYMDFIDITGLFGKQVIGKIESVVKAIKTKSGGQFLDGVKRKGK